MKATLLSIVLPLFIVLPFATQIKAQQYNCVFKPPLVKIDFGSGDIKDINSAAISNYGRQYSICPLDGNYSFVSGTGHCFGNDWFTIKSDHTANENGNMMLVNASETGGVFFNTTLYGFSGNATYQLSVWMMNVCRINGGCAPLPPNITIAVLTPDGRKAGIFKTGLLTQTSAPQWRKFTAIFQIPAGATSLKLIMADNTLGGCGNDFAMDDITISECINARPETKDEPAAMVNRPLKKQSASAKTTSLVKPYDEKKVSLRIKQAKIDTVIFVPKPLAGSMPAVKMPVNDTITTNKLPGPIVSRANPIVKQIETEAGEIVIDLYDNGEIDGDTVSVYHNNELIVSQAALTAKPVNFHIKVDKRQPHHEITLVAENLGSIPPNTSVMIITANGNRYEVFISSSKQKNAKVVLDLKE